MYEIHGWIVVRQSTDEEDDAQKARTLADLGHRTAAFRSDNPSIRRFAINGDDRVTISALLNHYGPAAQQALDLYDWIGTAAPASYGLMYVRDDENPSAANRFVVHVMRRGKITVETDSFLSPCVPSIED